MKKIYLMISLLAILFVGCSKNPSNPASDNKDNPEQKKESDNLIVKKVKIIDSLLGKSAESAKSELKGQGWNFLENESAYGGGDKGLYTFEGTEGKHSTALMVIVDETKDKVFYVEYQLYAPSLDKAYTSLDFYKEMFNELTETYTLSTGEKCKFRNIITWDAENIYDTYSAAVANLDKVYNNPEGFQCSWSNEKLTDEEEQFYYFEYMSEGMMSGLYINHDYFQGQEYLSAGIASAKYRTQMY